MRLGGSCVASFLDEGRYRPRLDLHLHVHVHVHICCHAHAQVLHRCYNIYAQALNEFGHCIERFGEMAGRSTRPAPPPAPPPSSTDQAMDATMAALAGARLVGGPATAAERAATGVDTYLVDSDSDEEAETTTAIADFERRLAARQPPSSAAPVAAPQQRLPATNSKR